MLKRITSILLLFTTLALPFTAFAQGDITGEMVTDGEVIEYDITVQDDEESTDQADEDTQDIESENENSDAEEEGSIEEKSSGCSDAEIEIADPDAQYDGYIVKLKTDRYVEETADGQFVIEQSSNEEDIILEDIVTDEVYKVADAETVESLADMGIVEYAEPNHLYELMNADTDTLGDGGWSYSAVHTAYANDLGLDGTGVRIAVLDTGINPENLNLKDANILSGYDFYNETAWIDKSMMSDIDRVMQHGSSVSQVIAGNGIQSNNRNTVKGAATGADIIPVNVFFRVENSGIYSSDEVLIKALTAIADGSYTNGEGQVVDTSYLDCDVINMSLGNTYDNKALAESIRKVQDKGVIVVCGSGNVNSSTPQGSLCYPAAYDGVIGVGGIDNSFNLWNKSVESDAVDVYAPGDNIPCISNYSSTIWSQSGTSFACPAVAASVALMKQAMPDLTGDMACEILKDRSLPVTCSDGSTPKGAGYIDYEALFSTPLVVFNMDQSNASYISKNGGTASVSVSSASSGNGTLKVSGWTVNGGRALAALYNSNNRYKSSSYGAEATSQIDSFSTTLNKVKSGDKVKLFIMSSSTSPITDSLESAVN